MRRRSAIVTMAGSSASTAVAALQSLVLLPLYLSEIGVAPYGAWLATGEVLAWMLAFDFGVPNLLIQRSGAALARGDYRAVGSQFAASLVALLALALLVASVVWTLAPTAAAWAGEPGFVPALRLAGIATAIMVVANGFVGLARGLQDTGLVQSFAVLGGVTGFVATAWSLLHGSGVLAIAYGLVARSSLSLAGGVAFMIWRADRRVTRSLALDRATFFDLFRNCPPMFASGLAYAVTTNSMVTLAAVLFGPGAATVLGVTRKAADIVRLALDMVGHATYAGFANLYASGDDVRTRAVYRELQATFFLVACPLMAAYVAVNPALVASWVGDELFGGTALTVGLALALTAGPWSYMQVSLVRATGGHREASGALIIECAARIALTIVLASWLGLVGFALGTLATSTVLGAWATRRVASLMGSKPEPAGWALRALPLAVAAMLGATITGGGWAYVLAAGLACVLGAALLLCLTDRDLGALRSRLTGGRA